MSNAVRPDEVSAILKKQLKDFQKEKIMFMQDQ
jgi:hypothetical protein